MFWSKKKPTVFSIKEGRMVGARKVATITYETDYEMPCTAGICGRQKSRKPKTLGGVFVSVCVCVWCPIAALRVRFPVCLGGLVVSLYTIHMKQTSWDAGDTVFLTAGSNPYVPSFLMLLSWVGGGGGGGKVQPVYHTVYTYLHAGLKLPSLYQASLHTD